MVVGGGGGILISVRDFIPCKKLRKHAFPHDIEGMFIELNFRKSKWLLFATYHPPAQNVEYYLRNVGSALDKYIKIYDKCLLVGDFNAEVSETKMENFLGTSCLSSLIHEKTCYTSLINPSCIDLFFDKFKEFVQTFDCNISRLIRFSQDDINCFKNYHS